MVKIDRSALDENQQKVSENFPQGHWLSDQEHADNAYYWITYYRRNPHRFVEEYLGIKLYLYQKIILFMMFLSDSFMIIAARAVAKSFIISIYACVKAILWPGSMIVITSGTKGQSGLIISAKIQNELCNMSPVLRAEIETIKVSQVETSVKFRNGSTIETVTLSENARGHRSTVNVMEEGRTCDKQLLDQIISPFRIVRQADFRKRPEYSTDLRFQEEPGEVVLSSATDDQHWMYKQSVDCFNDMLKGGTGVFLALDYAITLRHGIRTRKQMITDFHKLDPITVEIEYCNRVLKQNSKAYFAYNELKNCQTLVKPFFPRTDDDYIARVRNKYAIPKLDGEIRVVSADLAFVNRSGNDNSCFTCMRLVPDSDESGQKIYKCSVPYIETMRGSEMRRQAIRIRQLFEDFNADYIVLDVRSAGVSVYDLLARPLRDDNRGVEYAPFRAMNDEAFAARVNNPNAEDRIFCVSASLKLNSEIAVNLKSMLLQRRVEFLIPYEDGIEELKRIVPEYLKITDPDERLRFETPYLETMLMISETVNLQYEKAENTGLIKIREQGSDTKDRYTSVSYAAYFASMLARDMLNDEDEINVDSAPVLVTDFL